MSYSHRVGRWPDYEGEPLDHYTRRIHTDLENNDQPWDWDTGIRHVPTPSLIPHGPADTADHHRPGAVSQPADPSPKKAA